MNRSIAAACLACTLFLSACASSQQEAGVIFSHKSFDKGDWQARPALIEEDGQPAALYLDASGRVQYQTKNEVTSLPEVEGASNWQFFGLHQQGKELFATYWSHIPKKAIYISTSNDGGKTFSVPEIANGTQAEPLYPFTLLAPQSGASPSVIYQDERKNNYHIYINHYESSKKAWSKTDEQLDVGELATNPSGVPSLGEFPTVFHHADSYIVTWLASVYTAEGKRYRLLSRQSNDGGQNWGPINLVVESPTPVAPSAGAYVNGKFALVTMVVGKGLVAAYFDEKSGKWALSEPLPDSDLNINSGMQVAAGKGNYKNNLYIVWSAQKPDAKPFVMAAAYDVNENKWIESQTRLDKKEYDQTKSTLPVIATDGAGNILTAWVDYRNILPNVYVSGSLDGGKNWTKAQNVQLNGLGSGLTPVLIGEKNSFTLSYQAVADLLTHKRTMYVREVKPLSDAEFGPFPISKKYTNQEMKNMLEKREKEFWTYRIESKPAEVWNFYDPAYKAFVPQEPFIRLQKDFKYFNYKVLDVAIKGNIAKVSLETTFEIPGTMVFGREIKQAKRTAKIEETWLWIGDDWYQQFNNPITGSYLEY